MNTAANKAALLSLKKELQANPTYKEVVEGDAYQTTRYKTTETVYVHKVKAHKIQLKRTPDAKDSFTISRAEFDRYYKKA